MYDTKARKIPASWADLKGDESADRDSSSYMTDQTVNGHSNGTTNGAINGHVEGESKLPTSFLEGKAVRTVYGLVSLKNALDWPVHASFDELAACAAWFGGRIPTADEAHSIYEHVDALKREEAERKLGRTVPAVNG
jgi:L-histidine Nalpha-methyltransferase / hercynylcysteine S-oxide synthase